MTSTDVSANEFLRKDVYEADQRALMAEIKLGNAEILKRIDQLETKIEIVNSRLDALDSRISDTHTYMGWGIAFIGIIVAIAVVALPVSEFFRKILKPSVYLDDIEKLIDNKLERMLNARLGTNRGV